MLVFLIIGAIAGIMLGVRFKVLVLVPAFLLATVIIIIVNGSSHSLGAIVLTVLGTVASLQVGYIVGSILRAVARAYLPARTTERHQCPGSKPAR